MGGLDGGPRPHADPPALLRRAALALLAGLLAATPAQAACPLEKAVYAEIGGKAEIAFRPVAGSVTASNAFALRLDDATLDGIVMWPAEEPARSIGMLMHGCPEGDVTGAELDACILWQGVVYSLDTAGTVGLLPASDAEAPARLVLPDLGPSLAAAGDRGFDAAPWDVFAWKACAP